MAPRTYFLLDNNATFSTVPYISDVTSHCDKNNKFVKFVLFNSTIFMPFPIANNLLSLLNEKPSESAFMYSNVYIFVGL
jgi:hypothetical protein